MKESVQCFIHKIFKLKVHVLFFLVKYFKGIYMDNYYRKKQIDIKLIQYIFNHCTNSFKHFSGRNEVALFEFYFIIFQNWLFFEIFRLKVAFPYVFTFTFNSNISITKDSKINLKIFLRREIFYLCKNKFKVFILEFQRWNNCPFR